jgi:hypothetical protein
MTQVVPASEILYSLDIPEKTDNIQHNNFMTKNFHICGKLNILLRDSISRYFKRVWDKKNIIQIHRAKAFKISEMWADVKKIIKYKCIGMKLNTYPVINGRGYDKSNKWLTGLN